MAILEGKNCPRGERIQKNQGKDVDTLLKRRYKYICFRGAINEN